MQRLKPYCVYDRLVGASEGAALALAPTAREAKRMAWPVLREWWDGFEFTDIGCYRLPAEPRILALADKALLSASVPHVVESPLSCAACAQWGAGVDREGRCLQCGGDAGLPAELVAAIVPE